MTSPESTTDYLLLFRGTDWDRGLSPEQLQRVVADWYAWFEKLGAEGKCLGGHPLQNTGKLVSGRQGRTVADGPFAESKEAIGGYFFLRVANEAEAVSIAQRCPGLPHGLVVEVRPVAPMCPASERAQQLAPDQGLQHPQVRHAQLVGADA